MPTSIEEALKTDPPCHPRACAIQDCLVRNNYNESRCTDLIDALYDCCSELYKRDGPGANSTCCPKESLLKLKMKQRAEEKGSRGAEVHQTRRR
ncbi:DUF1903-domain-containing protein [Choiromyces venosus 120613-1]|uniref:Cx9C motif-containing protein 4, mitochondrial n=1 Tax=Choiromyces venosus 120613-1 TaxID=1336337 RepID=A0A3N4JFA5_9PEZI|nr:DUF1903-domain-containing protein [Choiromyces venosus 120613-1]